MTGRNPMSIGQQQAVGSLWYYLYDHPLHPELFDICRNELLQRRHYSARLWVTGCRHVIGFTVGDQTVTEVLADADAELPPRGCLTSLALRGEKVHEMTVGDIRYMMNFQREIMSDRVYANTHDELARIGQTRGLFADFPTWTRHPSLRPFSFLDYEANAKHLHVFAYHAFPEDLTLVKIQSIFEVG